MEQLPIEEQSHERIYDTPLFDPKEITNVSTVEILEMKTPKLRLKVSRQTKFSARIANGFSEFSKLSLIKSCVVLFFQSFSFRHFRHNVACRINGIPRHR